MLKHALITSDDDWAKMIDYINDEENLVKRIHESIQIKANVVKVDPNEEGLRKTLNYGHTLGHAIESYFLENSDKKELLHGEAIAIGMVLATYISHKLLQFPFSKLEQIKEVLINLFGQVVLTESDYSPIIELMKYDKKNYHGNINFVLLKDVGNSKIDCIVSNELIIEAFNYYNL